MYHIIGRFGDQEEGYEHFFLIKIIFFDNYQSINVYAGEMF
jgi:hypothetical protein